MNNAGKRLMGGSQATVLVKDWTDSITNFQSSMLEEN
jgi:hypothetical protein